MSLDLLGNRNVRWIISRWLLALKKLTGMEESEKEKLIGEWAS